MSNTDDAITVPETPSTRPAPMRIQLTKGGPYLVSNGELVDVGGKCVKSGIFALCACGKSENKPACDGSHAK